MKKSILKKGKFSLSRSPLFSFFVNHQKITAIFLSLVILTGIGYGAYRYINYRLQAAYIYTMNSVYKYVDEELLPYIDTIYADKTELEEVKK